MHNLNRIFEIVSPPTDTHRVGKTTKLLEGNLDFIVIIRTFMTIILQREKHV